MVLATLYLVVNSLCSITVCTFQCEKSAKLFTQSKPLPLYPRLSLLVKPLSKEVVNC